MTWKTMSSLWVAFIFVVLNNSSLGWDLSQPPFISSAYGSDTPILFHFKCRTEAPSKTSAFQKHNIQDWKDTLSLGCYCRQAYNKCFLQSLFHFFSSPWPPLHYTWMLMQDSIPLISRTRLPARTYLLQLFLFTFLKDVKWW